MNILKPGTGNKSANVKAATEYITSNIFEVETVDVASGRFTSTAGDSYQVFAYAETSGAFISTPKTEKSKDSIDASGLSALMFRQIRNDHRSFVYKVDPLTIFIKPNSSTAEWTDVSKVATRMWICTNDEIRVVDKIARNS